MQNPVSMQSVKIAPFFSIAGLVVVLMVSGCSNKQDEDAAQLKTFIDNATNYMANREYKSALIEAQNAYQIDENNQAARRMLGKIFVELGQPKEAIGMLESIKDPESETRLVLAKAYLDTGRMRSSRTELENIPETKATLGRLSLLRGRIALANAEYDEADRQFTISKGYADSKIQARVASATNLLRQGKMEVAETELESVVKDDSNNPEALYLLARVRNVKGDLDGSEAYLMQAMAAIPTNEVVTPLQYSVVAALRDNLTQQGKTSEALIYSGVLSDLIPGAEETEQRLNAALDSIQAGRFDAARSELAEVRELAPNSEQAGTMLAVVEFLDGNTQAAVDEFEKYIDPETSTSTALQMFAVAELRLNQSQKVIDRLKADIDDTKNGKLAALYGIAQINVGDKEAAERYLKKAISLEPTNSRLKLPLARLYQSEQKNDAALDLLKEAFEAEPSLPVVQAALIDQYVATGQLQEADKLVASLESDFPGIANTQLIAGNYYFRSGKAKQAIAALNRSLKAADSNVARHLLARTQLQTQDYEAAEAGYRHLIEVNPEDVAAYKGLLTSFELQNKADAGLNALQEYAKKSEADAPKLTLGEYYGRKGELEKAKESIANLKLPTSAQATRLQESLMLAEVRQLTLGDKPKEAVQLLQKKIEQYPDSTRLIASLATLEINNNDLAAAEALIEKLKSLGDAPIIKMLSGDVASKRRDYKTAYKIYYQSWKETPADQVAFKIFQTMELAKMSEPEITSFLQEWVDASTVGGVAQFTQGGYLLSINQNDGAKKAYESVVEKDPKNIVALNNLAWIYGEAEPVKALKAAEAAYQLAQKSPEVQDTYGWFLFKNGDRLKAKDILTQAANALPENAEIQTHLKAVLDSDE